MKKYIIDLDKKEMIDLINKKELIETDKNISKMLNDID